MGFVHSTHPTRWHFERSVLMTKDAAMHSSTRAVRVGGADIHVTEWGAGPPVLLLHGNPDSGIMWEGIAERLAPHYRCIAPARLWPFGSAGQFRAFARRLGAIRRTILERRRDRAAARSRGTRFRRPVRLPP